MQAYKQEIWHKDDKNTLRVKLAYHLRNVLQKGQHWIGLNMKNPREMRLWNLGRGNGIGYREGEVSSRFKCDDKLGGGGGGSGGGVTDEHGLDW